MILRQNTRTAAAAAALAFGISMGLASATTHANETDVAALWGFPKKILEHAVIEQILRCIEDVESCKAEIIAELRKRLGIPEACCISAELKAVLEEVILGAAIPARKKAMLIERIRALPACS
jgi:hypothetical protein